jgi:hypothetical protein
MLGIVNPLKRIKKLFIKHIVENSLTCGYLDTPFLIASQ